MTPLVAPHGELLAIVFDCDGVLVDSEELSCGATADLLVEHGVRMDGAEVRRRFLGCSIDAVLAHCARLGRPLDAGFAERKDRLYIERARGRLRPMPGAVALLEAIEGRIPVAVATSGSPQKVAFSLAETGLARFFSIVCTSREVPRGKPAPDLFLLAARRLTLPPARCAAVEDSVPGVLAGVAAGMRTIGHPSSLPRAALIDAGAHVICDDLRDILALLPCAPPSPSA